MMKKQFSPYPVRTFVLVLWCFLGLVMAEVPQAEIDQLKNALEANQEQSSEARKRLAVKRVIRDGGKLLEAYPKAENRFEVLGVLFQAQRTLVKLDDSSRNKEALLETGKDLIKAPDEYAHLRLEADLLLSQIGAARQGADSKGRLATLLPMVERYRDTPAEARMLQTALVMALETGDPKVIKFLRNEMAVRFAGDLDMINFQRDKLGGQVFGAPFAGIFKASDGSTMHLPADALGKSTVLYFWSQKSGEEDHLQRLAEEWNKQKAETSHRLQIISFNLDGLPDAGEKILRDLGVEWPALHLPGGRDHPLYKTFPRRDPYLMTLSPTGYAALIMSGSTRKKTDDTGKTDFSRWFGSSLARDWSRERYTNQLRSLFAGDFFVTDAEGLFNPALPPEIKALSTKPTPLPRTANSVPEEELQAIQACFVQTPQRYRLTAEEVRSNYQKAETLCAKTTDDHPEAPDLWIVRNRRMVAQLGLWKLTGDRVHFERALQEAKAVLGSGAPKGADVLASFCVAKEELRNPDADPKKIVRELVEGFGGEEAPGPVLAAASLLCLDIANRGMHDEYREMILKKHADHPMMWTYVSFLLNREHRYWLFRVPFVAGWSYGRQHQWILAEGHPDEVSRPVKVELETFDGKSYRLPDDSGKWTILVLANSWLEQERSPIPGTVTRYLNPFIEKRGRDDVQVILAIVDGELGPLQQELMEKPLGCETMVLPGGSSNPLVCQLGLLDEDEQANALVMRPDGSLASFISGLTMTRSKQQLMQNLIEYQDEKHVDALIAEGQIEQAKRYIFELAPPFDPEAVDEKGRQLKRPTYSHVHLRARAKVFLALNDRKAALEDAQEVLQFLTEKGGWMSMRPNGLDEAEDFVEMLKSNSQKRQ